MTKRFLIFTSAIIFFAAGCGTTSPNNLTNRAQNAQINSVNSNQTADKDAKLKAAAVAKAFGDARMPLNQIEFFNAATDPEKLLGTPHQYVAKAKWQTKDSMVHTIYEYDNETDAQAAKTALEKTVKSGAKNSDYLYAHKNILLRLNRELVSETAAKFETILKSL